MFGSKCFNTPILYNTQEYEKWHKYQYKKIAVVERKPSYS